MEWSAVESKALDVVKTMSMEVERPGYKHYEQSYYEKEFNGPLATNGMAREGHFDYIHKGTAGVMVPDKPFTAFKFKDTFSASISHRVATSFSLFANQMENQQQSIASSFFDGAGGSDQKRVSFLLDATPTPQEGGSGVAAQASSGSSGPRGSGASRAQASPITP